MVSVYSFLLDSLGISAFNMFKLLLVTVLLGLAAANSSEKDAEIRSSSNEAADAEGNFKYSFESSNGIAVQESGNAAGVAGAAQWVSEDGVGVKFSYTADENGYHPVGDHLPVPQEIPEYIVRSIAYIAAHPNPESQKYQ